MGAGASAGSPFESVEAALAAGKTQAEIDAWLKANPAAAAPAGDAHAIVEKILACPENKVGATSELITFRSPRDSQLHNQRRPPAAHTDL